MRIFITGNATCANRGDAAILRGLIAEMEKFYPEAELIITSRFPLGSSYLLGRTLESDALHDINKLKGSKFARLWSKIFRNIRFDYLLYFVKYKLFRSFFSLPKAYKEPLAFLNTVDCVIQVGGSFFIDLYGPNQYEWLLLARLINKPAYLVGHSLGPFEIGKANKMASFLFPAVEKIYLREPSSYQYLDTLSTKLDNVILGTDTAWVMPKVYPSPVADAELSGIDKPIVAITVRELKPFDKRLGISQDEYESKFITQIEALIKKGYHIVCLSMCTGLDGYVKDDRMVGYRIQRSLPENLRKDMTVLMNEYNDLELGYILQKCKLLIGTRLHSVIISLRYNTPAIAIYYEHKSEGILNQLDLGKWSYTINDIGSKEMTDEIDAILDNIEKTKESIKIKVEREQNNCKKMIGEIFN